MKSRNWKQDIWDTTKAIFWGLAIFSIIINGYNVFIGADSFGIYIFVFSLIGLSCALFLTFLKNKQGKKLETFNR